MVKTSFIFDYPFEIVKAIFENEELRNKINAGTGEKKDLGTTKITNRISQSVSRTIFNLHIPFMSEREMLLKALMYNPYTKDDLLHYSTNTEHKDYPKEDKYVRCNVHYLATYAKKEGNKTRIYRLSHFNMEISMMNKFAGGSAAIKKTNEFIDGLKKACEEYLKTKGK